MKTFLNCINFEKTDSIELQVRNGLDFHLPEWVTNEITTVQVWLSIENSFIQRGPDCYVCRIRVATTFSKKVFFVECMDDSLYAAIQECSKMISSKILKERERKKNKRGRFLPTLKKAFAT